MDVRGVAIDLVKRMGIYEKICNRRTQVELGQYVDAEGNILHEEKGERFAFRQGEDVEINRGDLVEILIDAIEGVPSHFNQLIVSIKQRDGDVEVRFKDGRTEHYDLVIGADGLQLLSGALFIFLNRRKDHMKVFLWDKDGLVIWFIHKKIQKFAKNHDRCKVLPRSKINDENDLTI